MVGMLNIGVDMATVCRYVCAALQQVPSRRSHQLSDACLCWLLTLLWSANVVAYCKYQRPLHRTMIPLCAAGCCRHDVILVCGQELTSRSNVMHDRGRHQLLG
jgi:hypothetical protein